MAEAKNKLEQTNDNPVDDRGTDAAGGLALLRRPRDEGFESDGGEVGAPLARPGRGGGGARARSERIQPHAAPRAGGGGGKKDRIEVRSQESEVRRLRRKPLLF